LKKLLNVCLEISVNFHKVQTNLPRIYFTYKKKQGKKKFERLFENNHRIAESNNRHEIFLH